MWTPCWRKTWTQNEWNVPIITLSSRSGTNFEMRCIISRAALLVNVRARTRNRRPLELSRIRPTRHVSAWVLPDPDPASTSMEPSCHSTASSWIRDRRFNED